MNKALISALLLAAGGCASLPHEVATKVIDRWEGPSAEAGRALLQRYGVPDDVTPNQLVWDRRGVWKRTVVWNRAPVYRTPGDLAVMEQTVDYRLDLMQTVQLLAFSDGLVVDLAHGELSSRAGNEGINYLTLNLADEIVRGAKTVQQAQAAYTRIVSLTAAGKTSPYTQKLLFASARTKGP